MSQPHICPTCSGHKTTPAGLCPTCEGSGVVWEPGTGPTEAAADEATDALDLTYRPA